MTTEAAAFFASAEVLGVALSRARERRQTLFNRNGNGERNVPQRALANIG
jgi:hypothetical protein